MKLKSIKELEAFKDAIYACKGDVWLESMYGDRFNLKSTLSRYIAFGKIISQEDQNLELFCALPEDERNFYKFFSENPETL